MKRILFFSLMLGGLLSCSPDEEEVSIAPKACFEISSDLFVGSPLLFNSGCAENAESYAWDFGDGTSSAEANPTHTYVSKGTYEVSLEVTGAGGVTHQASKTLQIAAAPGSVVKNHYGEINADEVWEVGIHYIFGDVVINDATVTIKPGAIVKFRENKTLFIGTKAGVTKATLIAEGTASQPIIFTADTETPRPGYYHSISFGKGNTANTSLKYCRFEWGGGSWSGGSQAILVNDTQLSLENSVIRQSAGHGINVTNSGSFAGIVNNEIKECALYAVTADANAVHTLTDANTLVSDKGFGINSSRLSISSATWKKLSRPYELYNGLEIGSEAGTTLTIAPGTILKSKAGIVVGNANATLIAEGTPDQPIIFTSGKATPAPSDWAGIYFYAKTNPASSLKHCIIEYAGGPYSNLMAALRLEWTTLNVNNCTIRHSAPYAIWLNEEAHFTSFSNNTIDNAAANGISIYGNWVHTLGSTSTITAQKGVVVQGDNITHSSVTWPKFPFPYYMKDWLTIGNATGSTLTLQPGTKIIMEMGKGISVGGTQYTTAKGGLIANGTAAEPILFSVENPNEGGPQPGNWQGIAFYEGTLSGSILNYCTVEYAGDVYSQGSVYVRGTSVPSITNTKVQFSGGYGISLESANPAVSNNTFLSNAAADYYRF